MKSPLWRALALIAMSMLIPLLMLEDAQAARRSGLAGNLQITDPDDVFIFPHQNIRYRDRMTIDMGGEQNLPPAGAANTGSAHVIFGSESWALNLAASRADFLTGVASGFWGGNDRGSFGQQILVDPGGPTTLDPFAFNWVDASFAYALSGSEIGFRLGIGRAAENSTVTNSPTPAAGDGETDDFARIVHIQASWGNETLDLGGEFSFGSSGTSDTQVTPNIDLEGGYTEFAIGLRKYLNWGGYEWTLLGAFAHQNADADRIQGATTVNDEQSVNAWQVGFGPCWRNAPETWQVAAQVYVGSQIGKSNPAGNNDEDTLRIMTAPGFIGSMEYVHGRWAVRGGARSFFDFERTEDQDPGVDPAFTTFEDFSRSYSFTWTAGASVALGDNFLVDVAINEQKILDGPAFLGAQNNNPAFVLVSATLNWGGSGE